MKRYNNFAQGRYNSLVAKKKEGCTKHVPQSKHSHFYGQEAET